MPSLVPGIHAFDALSKEMWVAGTSPAMTEMRARRRYDAYF